MNRYEFKEKLKDIFFPLKDWAQYLFLLILGIVLVFLMIWYLYVASYEVHIK